MRGGTGLRNHFLPAALGHLAQKIRLCAIRSRRSRALPCSPQSFSTQYRRDMYFTGPNPVRCLVQKLDRAFTSGMRRLFDMGRRNAEMIGDKLRTIAQLRETDLRNDGQTIELADPSTAGIRIRAGQRLDHQAKRIMNTITVVELANADNDRGKSRIFHVTSIARHNGWTQRQT
jgi:hypothetical protein